MSLLSLFYLRHWAESAWKRSEECIQIDSMYLHQSRLYGNMKMTCRCLPNCCEPDAVQNLECIQNNPWWSQIGPKIDIDDPNLKSAALWSQIAPKIAHNNPRWLPTLSVIEQRLHKNAQWLNPKLSWWYQIVSKMIFDDHILHFTWSLMITHGNQNHSHCPQMILEGPRLCRKCKWVTPILDYWGEVRDTGKQLWTQGDTELHEARH